MNWLAALFTLGYAGQAGLLVVLGTETTPALHALAVGNALLCSLLLWIWCFWLNVRRPRDASRHLVLVAVVLLAPAFFLPTLSAWYEEAGIARRVAATDLHDVTDEALYSARGNLLGVRVGFTLIPPGTDYYGVEPVVLPPVRLQERLEETLREAGLDTRLATLRTVRRTIDPQPTAINARRLSEDVLYHAGGGLYLEAGVAYGFTFDLLPGYLLDPRDPLPVRNTSDLNGYCLALPDAQDAPPPVPMLRSLDRPEHWRIAVQQTTFGWGGTGQPTAATLEVYAPAQFYRGIKAEGFEPCAGAS